MLFVWIEIQKEIAEIAVKNVEINGFSEKIDVICRDIREKDVSMNGAFGVVFSNPPYMKTDSGKANVYDEKNIARHEVCGDIRDFCIAAKRLLKFGGVFAVVYRPDRLCDLFSAMRESTLEPKRITFVHADTRAEPSMALVEAKKGGRCGLMVTKPLIIYADMTHTDYSDDMNYIMENGSFPEKFTRR